MTTRFGPRTRPRRLGPAVLLLSALAAALLGASPAGAGGWAVTSLDTVPAVVAGEESTVGFTIRQHGVRPVNPDGEVGIDVRDAAGREHSFAARPRGPEGHFVATVRIPEAGTARWTVRQGWFGRHDLGRIEVGTPGAGVGAVTRGDGQATVGGSGGRWPLAARILLPLAGVAFGAAAIVLAVQGRRRAPGLPAT